MRSGTGGAVVDRPAKLGQDDFREISAALVSGVCVVTARTPEGSWLGMTASAFCPLSLNPPLFLVCVNLGLPTLAGLRVDDDFVINVLAQGQADVALNFARRQSDKFAAVEHRAHPEWGGLPVLDGASAALHCTVSRLEPIGDHVVVVGEMRDTDVSGLSPLAFHSRRFWDLAATWEPRFEPYQAVTFM